MDCYTAKSRAAAILQEITYFNRFKQRYSENEPFIQLNQFGWLKERSFHVLFYFKNRPTKNAENHRGS